MYREYRYDYDERPEFVFGDEGPVPNTPLALDERDLVLRLSAYMERRVEEAYDLYLKDLKTSRKDRATRDGETPLSYERYRTLKEHAEDRPGNPDLYEVENWHNWPDNRPVGEAWLHFLGWLIAYGMLDDEGRELAALEPFGVEAADYEEYLEAALNEHDFNSFGEMKSKQAYLVQAEDKLWPHLINVLQTFVSEVQAAREEMFDEQR